MHVTRNILDSLLLSRTPFQPEGESLVMHQTENQGQSLVVFTTSAMVVVLGFNVCSSCDHDQISWTHLRCLRLFFSLHPSRWEGVPKSVKKKKRQKN